MTVPVDDADLVVVGAVATGVGPDVLLDGTEVAALARIVARVEDASTPFEEAAAVLCGIAGRRPFPTGNRAAAWLGAAYVLAANGLSLRISDAEATALVRAAEGFASEREVVDVLRDHVRPPGGTVRRVLRFLAEPRSVDGGPWPCPACARPVDVDARSVAGLRGPTSREAVPTLMALCRRQHGTHDRTRRAPPAPPFEAGDTRWCPVVRANEETGQAFLAVSASGGVAFFPGEDESARPVYEVAHVRELHAGDLAGDWAHLRARADAVGRVAASAVHFDDAGEALDWHHLARVADDAVIDRVLVGQ
jgi:prophage maintenance system killer protein